jgi:hypothetical protein
VLAVALPPAKVIGEPSRTCVVIWRQNQPRGFVGFLPIVDGWGVLQERDRQSHSSRLADRQGSGTKWSPPILRRGLLGSIANELLNEWIV